MRKLCLLIALTGVMTSLQCWALTVNVTRIDGYYTFPGGEFNVASVASDPNFTKILGEYAPSAIVNGGFETFCDSTSTGIQNNPLNGMIAPGDVTIGAAWLYWQFSQGTLSGYDYLNTTPGGSGNSGRAKSAYALQQALWVLDGQTGGDVVPSAGAYYLNLAYSMFGNPNGGQTVSQPMLVTVPDGGLTMILLGVALSGLGLVFRKSRAA
jgi:hypothetical protein